MPLRTRIVREPPRRPSATAIFLPRLYPCELERGSRRCRRVEAWANSKWGYAKDILDTANLPLRRAIDKLGSIRNDLMTMAKQERPSAGVLAAIDYLKAAQDSSNATVALDAVKHSLSVLQGISGVANQRLRLAFLKGKLEALVGD